MVILTRVLRYWRYLGYVAIVAIVAVTTVDVSGRFLFNRPLPGGPELVEQLMVCIVFLMLPHISWVEKHIRVDFIIAHIAGKIPRLTLLVSLVFDIMILVLLALLAWQGFGGAMRLLQVGETTEVIGVPLHPFYFVLAVGFSLAFFAFLAMFVQHLSGLSTKMRRHS